MTLEEAQHFLKSRSEFDEAMMIGFASSNLLRTFNVIVVPVRDGSGDLLPASEFPRPELLCFENCQSVRIDNCFGPRMLGPEANWGLSEFAVLRVFAGPDDLLVFKFLWEVERVIEITCSNLRIAGDPESVRAFAETWLPDSLAPFLEWD